MGKADEHQGRWLKQSIAVKGDSVSGFARRIGVSRDALHKWFLQERLQLRLDSAMRIVKALGFDAKKLMGGGFEERDVNDKDAAIEHAQDLIFRAMSALHGGQQRWGRERVDQYRVTERGLGMPAVFNLDIAASGWVELQGEGITQSVHGGWVIVRVEGDSMEPRWKSSQHVMFRLLNPDEDEPVVGVDYFFIRNDSCGTFKRLASITEDEFTMRALNAKYPKKLKASRQEIVMVAEARFIVFEPPDE